MDKQKEGREVGKEGNEHSPADDPRLRHKDYLNSRHWWKEYTEGRITAEELARHLERNESPLTQALLDKFEGEIL